MKNEWRDPDDALELTEEWFDKAIMTEAEEDVMDLSERKMKWREAELEVAVGDIIGSIDSVIRVLQAAKAKFGDDAIIAKDYPGHDGGYELLVKYQTPETDRERSERLKKEAQKRRQKKQKEQREYQKYLELQKKFGE